MGRDGKSYTIILKNRKIKIWIQEDGCLLQVILTITKILRWIEAMNVSCSGIDKWGDGG